MENIAEPQITVWLAARDTEDMIGWASRTVYARVPLPADLNGDWEVNGLDAFELGIAFGAESASPSFRASLDLEQDGIIDGKDLLRWIELSRP